MIGYFSDIWNFLISMRIRVVQDKKSLLIGLHLQSVIQFSCKTTKKSQPENNWILMSIPCDSITDMCETYAKSPCARESSGILK